VTHASRRTMVAVALTLATGCAATRPEPPASECAELAQVPPHDALCGRDDGVRTLQARFRAEVDAGGSKRSAEGVLVWRAPGSLRVKLFTLAGLTVYDALWTGDVRELRGVVRQPLSDKDETFVLGPGDVPDAPDADLSLVLWSLWQPRCSRSPELVANATYALAPKAARAAGRSVRVAGGAIREETLVRTRTNGTVESVVVRYGDYDCAPTPLPRRVEIEAPASGWRARVTIIEQARDVTLDDALFALPPAPDAHAGS
jgi:outer membrane lipoprotein-sorting protein